MSNGVSMPGRVVAAFFTLLFNNNVKVITGFLSLGELPDFLS